MQDDIPQKLRDRIQAGESVLFLGAGATRDAGGPTGTELATLLAHHFGKRGLPAHNLSQFASMLLDLPSIDREDVDARIVASLKKLEPSQGHSLIPTLVWRAIFTTNYDRLLEIAYDTLRTVSGLHSAQDLHIAVAADEQVTLADRTRVTLFKLHGCISRIESDNPLVLTERDFQRTQKKRSKMLRFLKSLAREHSIIFIGYSFSDGVMPALLDDLERESPYHSRRTMYAVTPSPTETEEEFYASRRITCIAKSFTAFMEDLAGYFDAEANKINHRSRTLLGPTLALGALNLPSRIRASLDSQLEVIDPNTYPQSDPRPFLQGLPVTPGDLRNRNDIERIQEKDLLHVIRDQFSSSSYIIPLVVVLGPGGAGKSTLALRCAFELAESGEAVVLRLRSPDYWRRNDILDLVRQINRAVILVCDDIEVHVRYRELRDLRIDLSAARARALLLTSCQKAVWNDLELRYPAQDASLFFMSERLTELEAETLVKRLAASNLIELKSPKERRNHLRRIMEDYDGSLIVAMLSIVRNGNFRDILLAEYGNISERAKRAYLFVALIHQHRLSIPDYLLNALTVNDWQVFADEVIRLESDLIIVQDADFATGRLCFKARHPQIARVIVETILSRVEDRIRMYRKVISGLAASDEDRRFLLRLLTSVTLRRDVGNERYVEEFFEHALTLFPDDTAFIFHYGRLENKLGNTSRAFDLLSWGRSLSPHDSYILHELGICEEKKALSETNLIIRQAHRLDAQKLFREKQALDPRSHFGYSSEARLHLSREQETTDFQERVDCLAAAMDAVRRGLAIVREDDRAILKERAAEVVFRCGSSDDFQRRLTALCEEGGLRYASGHYLITLGKLDLGERDHAFESVIGGLERFPGDQRLINIFLDICEERVHEEQVRNRIRHYLGQRAMDRANLKLSFLRAVQLFYDDQFARSRNVFEAIRQALGRSPSSRIRMYLCDEDGRVMLRKGAVRLERRGLVVVTDQESGERIPLERRDAWELLGEPRRILFQLGFSLAGLRGSLVRALT